MDICAKIQEKVDEKAKPTLAVMSAARLAMTEYEAAFLAKCLQEVEAPIGKLLGAPPEPELSTRADYPVEVEPRWLVELTAENMMPPKKLAF